MKGIRSFLNALSVTGINNKDKNIGTFIIISPKRANAFLSANVPNSEYGFIRKTIAYFTIGV